MEGTPSSSDPMARLAVSATSSGRIRLRVGVGACIALVVLALVAAILASALAQQGSTDNIEPRAPADPAAGSASIDGAPDAPDPSSGSGDWGIPGVSDDMPGPAVIFVHVLGAVASPGLYQLRAGDRVVDVIAAAGGFAPSADPGGVNLARYVSDGEQLYVPEEGEVPPPLAAGEPGSAPGAGSGAAPGAAGAGPAAGSKVNLNTASLAELQTLPRVGPAMAGRILDWRETNGRFTSVEDLMSITGIGEKTFESLKLLVTI